MRPIGEVRHALLRALDSGACGTFDVLARMARVPQHAARCTLWEFVREGKAQSLPAPAPAAGRRRGRPRLVYAKCLQPQGPAIELGAVICASWR